MNGPLSRRRFLSVATAAALPAPPSPSGPNIVLILADDLGIGDLGCYGQKLIATPNLDRMAAEGMLFRAAYAGSPVCAPSRCVLMTGLHTGHARVRDNHNHRGERVPLRPDDFTVAELLKQAGYRTALIGKWGLGEAGTHGMPTRQGFDEFYGFLNQDHASEFYPRHIWQDETEIILAGNQGTRRKQFAQDLLTERALQFLDRNADRPFFLYLAYTMPHADSELARDTGDGYPVPDYGPYASRGWPPPQKGYAAAIHALDRDVGRVLERLRQLGIESNTLVLFTSDNGPASVRGHSPDFFRSAGPFRGYKGQLYEGGIRVPALARWPGHIPAGRGCDDVWHFADFLPTVAQLVGIEVPHAVDGVSFGPLLEGRKRAREPGYLYWEAHGGTGFSQAARMGRWKAVRHKSLEAPIELYDLEADPAESRNLADREPQARRRLEEILRAARSDSADYPVP